MLSALAAMAMVCWSSQIAHLCYLKGGVVFDLAIDKLTFLNFI